MSQNSPHQWLGTKDAAAHLGVAERTLWRLVDEGRVRAYRPSRKFQFKRSDLDEYLESTVVVPGTVSYRWQFSKAPAKGSTGEGS